MYRVEVDWAPAHELLQSLGAFINSTERKVLEMGPDWHRGVQEQVGPDLAAEAASLACHDGGKGHRTGKGHTGGRGQKQGKGHGVMPMFLLLAHLCPGERDADSFLRWLEELPLGELYACLAPYTEEGCTPPVREVGAVRDRYVGLISAWNERYFRHLDPAILRGLAADAAAKRALLDTMPPHDFVEMATNGVVYQPQPGPGPQVVLLVPQYHARPWNLFSWYHGLRIIYYPADPLPPAPGEPPPGLLRLTHALSDDRRLRILHYLAGGRRTFGEVVERTGLAKSTVHHHMLALRAASLVRVHDGGDTTSYSLRPSAVDELGRRLGTFLQVE